MDHARGAYETSLCVRQEALARFAEVCVKSVGMASILKLDGHIDSVSAVDFSPDGKYIASASWDLTVKIWDAQTGKCLSTLEGHKGYVFSVKYSPGGRLLVTSSRDRSVQFWDVKKGRCVRLIKAHASHINALNFSDDGVYLVTASNDETIKVWDVLTGKCVRVLQGHTDNVLSVQFSPEGQFILSSSRDGTIRKWDVLAGVCVRTIPEWDRVNSACFSADGLQIACAVGDAHKLASSGGKKNSVRLWDAWSGTLINSLPGHTACVNTVCYSPSGRLLASGSWDDTIRLWNPRTGKCVRVLEGHSAQIWGLSFSRDGRYLASAAGDSFVRVWDIQDVTEEPLESSAQDDTSENAEDISEGTSSGTTSRVGSPLTGLLPGHIMQTRRREDVAAPGTSERDHMLHTHMHTFVPRPGTIGGAWSRQFHSRARSIASKMQSFRALNRTRTLTSGTTGILAVAFSTLPRLVARLGRADTHIA